MHKFKELFAKNKQINIIFVLKRLKKTINRLKKVNRIEKKIKCEYISEHNIKYVISCTNNN
jgi:primosomal protein N''